jgi:4-hydroxy-tetrahydrodipicolinate reductase
MADLKVVIAGAGGRMGAANIRAVTAAPGIYVHGAFDRRGADAIGKDAGLISGIEALDVIVTDDVEHALSRADAIIDFTAPAATVALANVAAQLGLIHIVGTTGLSGADEAALQRAAQNGARIVKSGNFSPGVVMLASLVRKAAEALGDYDVEIVEMHHNKKVDAPSGTALLLGEAAAAGRNVQLSTHKVSGRDGHTGAREAGTIGFAALRGGSVVGDHTVIFAGPSERIELTHRAEDRTIFANGAVRAALWARGQKPGYYSMADVLGID